MSEKKSRSYSLDALKFFSMIIVFLCHLEMAFFNNQFTVIKIGQVYVQNYLVNGNLAVCMFLLISCFIFAKKAFDTIDQQSIFLEVCIKRYLRLFVPACLINAFIFLFYCGHLFFNLNAFDEAVPYINDWFNFGGPFKAFCSMLWADLNIAIFENGFNPPLWCYHYLFLFPVIAYGFIKLLKNKNSVVILCLLILPLCLLHNSYISVIPLALIIASDVINEKVNKRLRNFSCLVIIILCIILQSLSITEKWNILTKFTVSFNILLASSILCFITGLDDSKLLNRKIFYHLNKISFGIYLLHMPIICSIGFFCFIRFGNIATVIISVLIVLVVTSLLFHVYVEKKLTDKIIKLLTKKYENKYYL